MAKPFDATTKQIVAINPQDWLELLGFPRLPVEVVDADLATVTTDADRILRTTEPPYCLFHFEFEAGRDATEAPQRAHRYNALVESRYDLPVATILFLLNPRAGRVAEVTGYYEASHPLIGSYLQFRYRAIRIWELPVQSVLAGGIATLPLALLSDTTGVEPATIVETISRRMIAEAETNDETEQLISAAYILAGLRFSDTIVQSLFKGVMDMEESSTYQAILTRGITRGREEGIEVGRTNEARRLLMMLGASRLGTPAPSASDTVEAIASVDRLEQLLNRLFAVETWDDLLAS